MCAESLDDEQRGGRIKCVKVAYYTAALEMSCWSIVVAMENPQKFLFAAARVQCIACS